MIILVIDVQESFRKSCNSLIESIPKNFKTGYTLHYLWDANNSDDLFSEVPDEWIYDYDDNPTFFENFSKHFSKRYGFFRDLMDNSEVHEEDIIQLGQFMINRNIYDARDIFENPEYIEQFKSIFKNSPILNINFNNQFFSIPDDIIENIDTNSSYILVGGGLNECLAEISILLKMLNVTHTIDYNYTY